MKTTNKKLRELKLQLDDLFEDMESYTGKMSYEDALFEKVWNFIETAIKEAVKAEREEIAKQLKMTVLLHEQEMNKRPKIIESLESKIRAFIRHELLNEKE